MGDSQVNFEKKIRSYKSAKTGAWFLTVMTWVSVFTMHEQDVISSDPYIWTFACVTAIIWPVLAYICALNIQILKLKQTLHDQSATPC